MSAYGPLLTNVVVNFVEVENLVFDGVRGVEAFISMDLHLEVYVPDMDDDFLGPGVCVRSKIVMVNVN